MTLTDVCVVATIVKIGNIVLELDVNGMKPIANVYVQVPGKKGLPDGYYKFEPKVLM